MLEIDDELKNLFEYELKTKLSLKSHSSNSEMILLYNTFRYFDEKNTGIITIEKWPKVFIKLGLTGFSEDDLRKIFNIYDKYKTGLINYQNFIKYIFNKENLEYIKPNFINRPFNNNNIFSYNNSFHKRKNSIDNYNLNNSSNTNNNIINNNLIDENNYKILKRSLSEKNFSPTLKKLFQYLLKQIQNKININNGMTYYTFALKIKRKEDKLKETISYEDLCKSLLESNILLNMDLIRDFFSILDLCELNSISSNELLRLIRGNINENRKNLITEQFNKINTKNEKWIDTIYLKSIYNNKEHPEVILGRKNENEIFTEFNYTLDIFLSIKKRENKMNYEDFIEYYIPISSSIDNDNYFENMIKGVWNIYNPYKNNLNFNNYKPQIFSENNNNNFRYSFNDIDNYHNNNFNNTQKYNVYNRLSYNNLNNNYLSKSHKNIFSKMNLNNKFNINTNNYNGNNNNDNYINYNNRNNNNIKINFNSDNNNTVKNDNFSKSFSYLRNKIHFNPILNQYIIPEENIELNNQKSNTQIINSNFYQNSLLNSNYQNENNPSENLNIFRNILISRGKKAIFTLQKIITMYDTFKTGKIDFQSFESICLSYKINLNHNQLYSIFSFFITDNSKKILYEKLFKSLIGNMNIIRFNLVKKVFDKLKKNTFGNVDLIDLKKYYNYKNHPDVILGIKNEKEIYNEFNDNLETYKNYLNNIYHSNKISFSFEDFINFYNQISLGIKDDEYFIKLINSVWDYINLEN